MAVKNNDYASFCCYNLGSDYKRYTAPRGYTYLVAMVHVKNDGYSSISTNPFSWKLTADGVTYEPDQATFLAKQPISQVEHGGKANFYIVYLVHGDPQTATLTYV